MEKGKKKKELSVEKPDKHNPARRSRSTLTAVNRIDSMYHDMT